MEMATAQVKNVTLIELTGRFDAYGAPQLEKFLRHVCTNADNNGATGSSPQVVINLTNVQFVDSTGLATLVQGMKRCRERQGNIHLCCLQQPVRIIIELTRLDKVFAIFNTQEEALEQFANEYQHQTSSTL